MNTHKMKLFGLLAALIAALPIPSAAFDVTDTDVYRLDASTALFTITYEFGFLNRDLIMPLKTQRTEVIYKDQVSYGFYSADDEIVDGLGPAIVLTNDPDVTVTDGTYHLPRGENAQFTLVGLLRLPAEKPFLGIHMAINNLPFTMVDGATSTIGVVQSDQLSAYQTQFVTLGKEFTIKGSAPATAEVKK